MAENVLSQAKIGKIGLKMAFYGCVICFLFVLAQYESPVLAVHQHLEVLE